MLNEQHPGSAHVRSVGLGGGDDADIWDRAKSGGFVVITKDADFEQRSFLHGAPPKVIWLRLGNCSAQEAKAFVERHLPLMEEFVNDPATALLVIPPTLRVA